MFISSKVKVYCRRADGKKYIIPEGFIGEIPEDVANSYAVRLAIDGGDIVTPETHAESEEQKPRKTRKK